MGKNCRRLTDAEREIIRFCWDINSIPVKEAEQRGYNSVLIILTFLIAVMTIINIHLVLQQLTESNTISLTTSFVLFVFATVYIYKKVVNPESKELEQLTQIKSAYYRKCEIFLDKLKHNPNLCQDSLELIEFYEEISKGVEKVRNNNKK